MSKPTGPRNKQRGYEHETQVVKAAEEHGFRARRAWGSNGRAMGLPADVDVAVRACFYMRGVYEGRDFLIQCKRKKRLPAYLRIPDSCHATVFREDRGTNYVVMRLEDLLELLK